MRPTRRRGSAWSSRADGAVANRAARSPGHRRRLHRLARGHPAPDAGGRAAAAGSGGPAGIRFRHARGRVGRARRSAAGRGSPAAPVPRLPARARPARRARPPLDRRRSGGSAAQPVVSLALRPAPVTDQWLRDGPQLEDIPEAMADVTLLEAPSLRARGARDRDAPAPGRRARADRRAGHAGPDAHAAGDRGPRPVEHPARRQRRHAAAPVSAGRFLRHVADFSSTA